jgi:hypothetical protein
MLGRANKANSSIIFSSLLLAVLADTPTSLEIKEYDRRGFV